ncbi:MAG: exodeoxyribonuclease V subunit gamma [Firmicutes bacterium]|nr:exodeoxyribonuclease V subunit gamma [Bacillota bacterium]
MGINVIRGSIGSGKSDKCIAMIAEEHKKNPRCKCIMLVPNHNSYETEKRFVEEFGGTGLNNIEVMTLRRLAMNLLSNNELNYITESGRQMLIHKSIKEYCRRYEDEQDKRLIAAIKKPGFADVMASLISEFKRYIVTPQALNSGADAADDKLKNKIHAAAGIYEIYLEYMEKSGYTDSEDDNTRLAERIASGEYFNSDTYVWADKFNEFTPQQINVLRAIAACGAKLTVTVAYPSRESARYAPMKKTMSDIDDLTDEFGMGEIIDTGCEFKSKKSAEIEFLLKNWGENDACWEKETEDIVYFSARDMYNEVETAACKIVDLAREEGMRYRDIAILCGNGEEYNHIIETVFTEYKIPYFTDSTVTLSDHPIAMQLLSVFDIFENDWKYEDVFRYLKSGFIYTESGVGKYAEPFDTDKIDFLENYVLKHGIRGKSRWMSEDVWLKNDSVLDAAFDRGEGDADETADSIRRAVAAPLTALYEKVGGKNTAEYFARALFDFLRAINLDKGLKYEISKMQKAGDMNGAEQFSKLWNLMLDVLNQTIAASGDEEITFSEMGEYIRAGLGACSIRTIPSGIDRVYVGSVEKSSAREVRAMFVIGANDGTFPNGTPDEGYFSNADREKLAEKCNIKIAPDTKKKLEKQYFKVYDAMCSVSERLFLSRPLQNSDGKTLTKSYMITDIEQLFPKLKNVGKSELDMGALYISAPEATIHKMIREKSFKNSSRRNPIWDAVYEWYESKDEWKNLLSLIDRAKWYMYPDIKLSAELAEELYKSKVVYSASRLNAFAGCPFGYYMQYGLRLKEREVWDITPADIGSYAHEVIKMFCEAVEDGAETDEEKIGAWRALTDEKRVETLDAIIERTCENMLKNNSRDKEKTASILKRTGKNIHNAAVTVHRALSRGNYAEHGMEYEFEMPVAGDIEMRGIIDRVDMCSSDEEVKLRIIDYKTGGTDFDVVNIVNGVDMQMVIYAIAARAAAEHTTGKKVRITGIYYNRVHNKSVTVEIGGGIDAARGKSEGELFLDGVTFAASEDELYESDNLLAENGKSDFLNIKLKKDGTVSGSRSVHTAEEIEGLAEKVCENITAIDGGIKGGNIRCAPYKDGGSLRCGYCAYKEICAFCNSIEPREKTGNAKDIRESMKGGEKDGGELDG